MIKLRRMGWVKPVACMGEKTAYGVSVRKPEGMRPLGRPGVEEVFI
jgi:hypothetical protein